MFPTSQIEIESFDASPEWAGVNTSLAELSLPTSALGSVSPLASNKDWPEFAEAEPCAKKVGWLSPAPGRTTTLGVAAIPKTSGNREARLSASARPEVANSPLPSGRGAT